MKLYSPFQISARLAPALKIGNAWLSYDNGKFVLDLPNGEEYVINDFRPGASNDLQSQFEAIVSFLSACAESRAYGLRNYGDAMKGENSDLFPAHVGEWAESFSDELSILSFELSENSDLIQ